MSWFSKQNAREIARRTQEKAEQWERAAAAARKQRNAEALPLTIQEVAAADLPDLDLCGVDPFSHETEANSEPSNSQPSNSEPSNSQRPNPFPSNPQPSNSQPSNCPALSPNALAALLLAGDAMTEWLLEERPSGVRSRDRTDPAPLDAPGWCLMCGRRGQNMRDPGDHAIGCAVGLWLTAKPK